MFINKASTWPNLADSKYPPGMQHCAFVSCPNHTTTHTVFNYHSLNTQIYIEVTHLTKNGTECFLAKQSRQNRKCPGTPMVSLVYCSKRKIVPIQWNCCSH